MRIYKVRLVDKIITVRRMKISILNSQFISLPEANFNSDDEVFVRCNLKGEPKFYNKQYIVYPLNLPVIEIINYENAVVRFFRRIIPSK